MMIMFVKLEGLSLFLSQCVELLFDGFTVFNHILYVVRAWILQVFPFCLFLVLINLLDQLIEVCFIGSCFRQSNTIVPDRIDNIASFTLLMHIVLELFELRVLIFACSSLPMRQIVL